MIDKRYAVYFLSVALVGGLTVAVSTCTDSDSRDRNSGESAVASSDRSPRETDVLNDSIENRDTLKSDFRRIVQLFERGDLPYKIDNNYFDKVTDDTYPDKKKIGKFLSNGKALEEFGSYLLQYPPFPDARVSLNQKYVMLGYAVDLAPDERYYLATFDSTGTFINDVTAFSFNTKRRSTTTAWIDTLKRVHQVTRVYESYKQKNEKGLTKSDTTVYRVDSTGHFRRILQEEDQPPSTGSRD